MVRQAKIAEEHRVALACHDNPKESLAMSIQQLL